MITEKKNRLLYNNFDLLRLIFASIVCLVHAYQLSRHEELRFLYDIFSAKIAVKAFFIVSGFLIFMSYEKSKSIRSYAEKRIRRIYPAYFFVVSTCAFTMYFISEHNLDSYFSSNWLKYIVANLAFLNFIKGDLPGVFQSNIEPYINGALWTIKIEVMFYATVPIIFYLFRRCGKFYTLISIYILSITYYLSTTWLADHLDSSLIKLLSHQLPAQLSYFVAGGAAYLYIDKFIAWGKYLILPAIAGLIIGDHYLLSGLEPLFLGITVIFCALFFYLGNIGKYGDFSYGIYILHFPIIQTLVSLGIFNNSPWGFLISVIALTALFSIFLWNFIEKPFLLRSSHYLSSSKN